MAGITEQPNERLKETDPQFAERMLHFADVEVARDPETELEPTTRYLPSWPRCSAARARMSSAFSSGARSTPG